MQRRLLEGDVRRHVDIAAKERMKLLRKRKADGSEHCDSAVLDFDLPIESDPSL